MDIIGYFRRIMNKSVAETFAPATDSLEAIADTLASAAILLDMANRPGISLYEGWQDEAGIDVTVWTVTDPATGAAWARGSDGVILRATSIPNANEICRLVSNQRWVAAPNVFGTNTILRKLVLEFELRLTNVANIDNTLFFLGLTSGIPDDRQSQDIIGWALLADVLQSVTDLGGVETTNTGFGEILTDRNKLKIEAYEGHVKFYINEVEVADHATNLPDVPFYINFFVDTNGGGWATIEPGIIRAWFEDIPS